MRCVSKSTRSAFTLVELLVVIILLGMFAVVAADNLTGITRQGKLKASVRKTIDLFSRARAQAVLNSINVYVLYDLENQRVSLIEPTPEEPFDPADSTSVEKNTASSFYLDAPIEIEKVVVNQETYDKDIVIIPVRDNGTSLPHSVTITSQKQSFEVTFDPYTGKATIK